MWRTDMATELMKDWIVELHNPERKQTIGCLGKMEDGVKSNCCLGVLEEVNGVVPTETKGGTLVYDGRTSMPSVDVISAVLAKDTDVVENEGGDASVALDVDEYGDTIWAESANDDLEWSFEMIARALIDKYLSPEEEFEVRKRIEDLGWA
jgi:hypothetical protein